MTHFAHNSVHMLVHKVFSMLSVQGVLWGWRIRRTRTLGCSIPFLLILLVVGVQLVAGNTFKT